MDFKHPQGLAPLDMEHNEADRSDYPSSDPAAS